MNHFLSLSDVSAQSLTTLLDVADSVKQQRRSRVYSRALAGKCLGMVFQKPSLRTRVSFDVGIAELGGRSIHLSPEEVGLGSREPSRDVARVLSRYVDCIVARVYSHAEVVELAKWATVPVVNALSDLHHPCQAVADMQTIRERFGGLRGLRLAYVGDGNNVAHSLAAAAVLCGMDVVLVCPSGYGPDPVVVDVVRKWAVASGSMLDLSSDPQASIQGANVVYTDAWTSMGQESEALARRNAFAGFTVSSDLMSLADSAAVFMHCLPAHRGEEVTNEVIESDQSLVFQQAENRLHAQKAVLLSLLSG